MNSNYENYYFQYTYPEGSVSNEDLLNYLISMKQDLAQINYDINYGFSTLHQDMRELIHFLKSNSSSNRIPTPDSYSVNSNGTAFHYQKKFYYL